MTRPHAWWLRLAPLLVLSVLAPVVVVAQQNVVMRREVTLNAFALRLTGPLVSSDSFAALFNGDTGVPVVSQVILGHEINNLTNNFIIYHGRAVTDTGEAELSSGSIPGIFGACYEAKIGSHANAFNIHHLDMTPIECINFVIDVDPLPHPDPPPKENCPILLDLALDGFHLSGPEPAVRFDIDADGTLDSLAWTRAGEDDAFLCLDRNHNGVIDDGRELFGFATPLLSGKRAQVGYRALAELDQPALGGNEDGKVDARDALFKDLCAWVDTNRDGMSQTDEIHSLQEVGVQALEYAYVTTRLHDSYGNLFRYASRAELRTPSGSLRTWPTYDVIFAEP
jgi:hypothetical protein